MGDWLTPDEVAGYLDLPGAPDDNLTASTAAAVAAVERRRSELGLDVAGVVAPADVKLGAMIWSALLYQLRSSPSGFDGFGDDTQIYDALGARRAEVMRLIGWRRAVVA